MPARILNDLDVPFLIDKMTRSGRWDKPASPIELRLFHFVEASPAWVHTFLPLLYYDKISRPPWAEEP